MTINPRGLALAFHAVKDCNLLGKEYHAGDSVFVTMKREWDTDSEGYCMDGEWMMNVDYFCNSSFLESIADKVEDYDEVAERCGW